MLSTKLCLVLALLALGVVCAQECGPDFCASKKCDEPQDCKGGKVPGGKCGCCMECAKMEGETCGGGQGLSGGTCDTGLVCENGFPFGSCKPQKQ